MLKSGVRVVGIDDSPFDRNKQGQVLVVGAIYRGGTWFDGLLTTKIRRDGWNATDRVVEMLCRSKFLQQLHFIVLDGVALGGFNIIDVDRLYRETGLKTAVFIRKRPNMKAIQRALRHLSMPDRRWALIQRAGEIYRIGDVFCQLKGLSEEEAADLFELTCTRAKIPEPLRAAHLIAGGLVLGQSGRRA